MPSISDNALADQLPGVVANIPAGSFPQGVGYDPARGEVFVTDVYSDNVSVINDSTNTVVATVPVGDGPLSATYVPDTTDVFVASSFADNVTVLNDSTNSVDTLIPVGDAPSAGAYAPNTGDLFTPNEGHYPHFNGTVSVIDVSNDSVVRTIPVGASPQGAAYDPVDTEVFVTNLNSNNVSAINTTTLTVVATISVGFAPLGIAYDPASGDIVATSGNNLTVISPVTNQVVLTVPVGESPAGVAYDGGTDELYVSNYDSNSVSVLNATSDQVVDSVPVGTGPFGVGYDPGTREVFVANSGSDNVSVIADGSLASSYAVSFSTSPTTCGSISFGGSNFTDDQTTHAAPGNYSVGAIACAGYALSSLSGSGGVSVSNGSATVAGTGTVAAVFVPTSGPSYEVNFNTVPASCGSVSFNGGSYQSGQSTNVSPGNYSVSAQGCTGHVLEGLSASGGISVAGGLASVTGPGTIIATFVPSSVPRFAVTFVTTPSSCGQIEFNGTPFTNGETGEYPAGNYTVTAQACSGDSLMSLDGSGGVGVGAGIARVSASGGVTAAFASNAPASSSGFLGLPGAEGYFVLAAVVAGVIAAAGGLFILRRSGRQPPESPQSETAPASPAEPSDP